jgi:hypothetical protein
LIAERSMMSKSGWGGATPSQRYSQICFT